MDNLKYYNDSFAYNYDIFAPRAPKKAEILEYPEKKRKAQTKSKSKAKAKAKMDVSLAFKYAIAVLVVAAVCGSLFLRAEISTLEAEINSINKEIVALDSEITRMDVEMERKISYANLEQAAEELGMQKCEKNQVTYIKTNQTDTVGNTGGELTAGIE